MRRNRYEKIVLEADKGITFKVSEGTKDGELIIRAHRLSTTTELYSNKYFKPPIPKGYKHILGDWNNGFVIERESDRSQFVWIPVGYLNPDGTLNGKDFTEKFGRRNYRCDEFSEDKFHETLTVDLYEQIESVRKYGGFYISRYNISISSQATPQSIKGVKPLTNISFHHARKVASIFEDTEVVKSHLTYGAEYDSVLAWLITSGVKTLEDISKDSTNWGNYVTDKRSRGVNEIVETGCCEEWCINNIYDFAGNVKEWTQEEFESSYRATRGGSYDTAGCYHPVAIRDFNLPYREDSPEIGFRVALYIK